jgi:hypothetical protein
MDDDVFEEEDIGRQKPTDYNSILLRQLERINASAGDILLDDVTAARFASNVEHLEIILLPYYDDKYTQYLEGIHLSPKNIVDVARFKLKGLMLLCKRKNLFPGHRGTSKI